MTSAALLSPGRPARAPADPAARPPLAGAGGARSVGRGFTLIELLVVMTIISLFIGAMGKLFSSGNGLTGLQAAENTVIGEFNLARSQASLTQQATRVLIFDDFSTPDFLTHYLCRFLVVGPDPNVPNNWLPLGGAPVDLPPGIFVLPVGPTIPNHLPGNVTWPAGRNSSFSNLAIPIVVNGISNTYYYVEFNALGATTIPQNVSQDGTYIGEKIALCEAVLRQPGDTTEPNIINFKNPENISGLRVSVYGTITQLNDAEDFAL